MDYQSGFCHHFTSEALPGALPATQNSPQKVPYGLYAEQFSGTAFTAPRARNRRTWLYRIRPGAMHGVFAKYTQPLFVSGPFDGAHTSPNQLRWDPWPIPDQACDFVDGLITIAGNGDAASQTGMAIHLYVANCSMQERFFYNADGELLIVPQQGRLLARTELGRLELGPGEILVIPRGMRFCIELLDGTARGYICENYGAAFELPELGPIGSNGLANARDFQAPVAHYEEHEGEFLLLAKFSGQLWHAPITHSPLDVVAWHGNCVPYKYDLRLFNTINTVSYDHPDPSIFTVLTSPSDTVGTANVDFVIFPPRWMVAEHTFRPPWFHRNVMSEYVGLIYGAYDAKADGFVPGGASLHNCMSGHGPDAATFEKAYHAALLPHHIDQTMAFMFESRYLIHPTEHALTTPHLQKDYWQCWQGLQKHFNAELP